MANQLLLVRHGELDERYRGRYVGRTDAPLSARGRRQARALSGPLAGLPGALFRVSPLARARETAGIALGADSPFCIDANLREIDFGSWEGMRFAEIAAADPAAVEKWAAMDDGFAFPGGEAVADFCRRIDAVAQGIATDPARTVVLLAHGGVIRFLICRLLGLGHRRHLIFDISPASISEIRIDAGMGVLTRLNDRHHLEEC